MSEYTYAQVVLPNGLTGWRRVPVTKENSYEGMPLLPRVNSHNDEFGGGSRVLSITQHLLSRDQHAAEVRRLKELEAKQEAERVKRRLSARSIQDIEKDAREESAYARVIDAD